MRAPYLKNNSKIYLTAPSFGCSDSPYKERLTEAIKILKKEGFLIIEGKNIFKNELVASADSKTRAEDFMTAYRSNVDLIMSVGGGEVMCEILPYINFEELKNYPPKWFMGYSDNTNLTYTLTTICDIETIYGPNAPSFYMINYDTLDAINLLKGKIEFNDYGRWEYNTKKNSNPLCEYNLNMKSSILAYNYINPIKGRLIGGCLDCLTTLCGTKFDNTINYTKRHKDEGIIFFLEACDLTSIGIKRALFQLKNASWFNYVKAFIIGRSQNYFDNSFNINPLMAYFDSLKEFNVPILLNVDIGHLGPSLPLRNGALATISLINNRLNIIYDDNN